MLVDNIETLSSLEKVKNQKKPEQCLMVSPDFFSIEYSINSYMKKSDGSLQSIDKKQLFCSGTI